MENLPNDVLFVLEEAMHYEKENAIEDAISAYKRVQVCIPYFRKIKS